MDVPPSDSFEDLYEKYRPLLLLIAMRRFGVPNDDAEELVHDVFLSFLRRWNLVRDVRPWLIGAICYACRHRSRIDGSSAAVRPDPA